jgi:hypothetical protein
LPRSNDDSIKVFFHHRLTILAVNPDAVASPIDDDIVRRLWTADEKVPIGRFVERLRFVLVFISLVE